MDYAQLKAMGVVSSHAMVRHEFTIKYFPLLPKEQWADPAIEERSTERAEAELVVYLRKATVADDIAAHTAALANRDPIYTTIHRCVLMEDGGRLFDSEEQASEINLEMFASLVRKLGELNGGAAKKSLPRMKRGARSRSPSAAGASRNGKKPSAQASGASGSNTGKSTARSIPA